MTAYRRNFIPGGCFFFTVNLADRRLRLLTEYVEVLRSGDSRTSSVHDRRDGRTARSSTHGLDDAGRQSGYCDALAADQIDVLTQLRRWRTCLSQPRRQR